MFPPAKIEYDDRLILRPPEPEDVPQIDEAFRSSLAELKPFMGWAHHKISREKLLERVLRQRALYFEGRECEFGVFDKESGEFLLYIGFCPTNRLNSHCLEIGFWTATKHAGKGLATLSTQILIAFIFEHFRGDRIEITCSLENVASRKVIEKCHFHYEGSLRNYYPEPTPEMVADGMVEERSVLLFSLIPEEREGLSWYPEIVRKLKLFPLLESLK